MGFAAFLGRLLFASVFILTAYQAFNEFGVNGGPASKALRPKIEVLKNHVTSKLGIQVSDFEIKYLVAVGIAVKGIGGILFIFGSSFGAYLLIFHQMLFAPVLYDFYNYDVDEKEFAHLFLKFTQNMALFGALLFFIRMKNSIPKRRSKKVPKTKTI
ncbi:HR-like lesion-inducer [Dillenia turbinata]|uniref:HR-like lesion-inducer n=1 Tax=Dillenia turbinata TaxID=194707 RepID=A0AAN8ZK97_9MAGN